MYADSFVLSAIDPETIVVAVVANDNWKRNTANIYPMLSLSASTKKHPTPVKGLLPAPAPKLRPNPKAQYVIPPNTTSRVFFIMMLTSFFGLTHPDSSRPNPENITK